MQKMYTGKKKPFLTNGSGKKWMSTCRRMVLDLYLSFCTKSYSKWITDQTVKHEGVKRKNGQYPKHYTYIEKNFLDDTQFAKELRKLLKSTTS